MGTSSTISSLRQQGINPFSLLADERPGRAKALASREPAAQSATPSAPASALRVAARPPRILENRAARVALMGAALLARGATIAAAGANSCSQLFKSPDGKFYDVYDNRFCEIANPAFVAIAADCGSKRATWTDLAARTLRGNWRYLRGSNSALDSGLRAESAEGPPAFEACAKAAFDAVLSALAGTLSPSPSFSPPPTTLPAPSSGSSGLPKLAIVGIAGASVAAVVGAAYCGWRRLRRGGSAQPDIELGRR